MKLKELVNSGRIGNVESSTVTFCTSALPIEKFPQGGEFFLDWKSGGNMYTIMLGHCMFDLRRTGASHDGANSDP